MPTLVLRKTMPSAAPARGISSLFTTKARRPDKSLEGVLIFSGLGLGLMVLGIVFRILELPPPVFF